MYLYTIAFRLDFQNKKKCEVIIIQAKDIDKSKG